MIRNLGKIVVLLAGIMFAVFVSGGASAADVSKLVETCASCHGKDGASTEKDVPIIGGYSGQYIEDSLAAYQNKERPCPEVEYRSGEKKGQKTDMCRVAKELSQADAKEVGKYFAGKPFVRAKQPFDAAKAKQGQKIHEVECVKCHDKGGSSPDDDAGILAGQWTAYLEETFKEYKGGKRPMPEKMKPKIDKLNQNEIDELLNYYASFQ
jgi:sulfide dehydrogenase cytochrome subunit